MLYKLQKWFIQLFLNISDLKWIDVHCYTWYSHEVESLLTKKWSVYAYNDTRAYMQCCHKFIILNTSLLF